MKYMYVLVTLINNYNYNYKKTLGKGGGDLLTGLCNRASIGLRYKLESDMFIRANKSS